MRVTESGWWRSGVTVTPVGGGEERVMVGAGGVGGGEVGEVVGVCVEGEVGGEVVGICVGRVVGKSHETVDGGSPAHSHISWR